MKNLNHLSDDPQISDRFVHTIEHTSTVCNVHLCRSFWKAMNNFDFEREFIKLRKHESLNTNAATDVTTIYEIDI